MTERHAITRPSSAALVALVMFASAGHARAQNASAEALFDEGTRLMAAGKLAEACQSFEASNEIEARAGTLIQLGACREQNHQLASAWSAYKDALNRVKDPRKRELAQAKVSELEPKLSYLTISVSTEAHLDGLAITRNGQPFNANLWNHALPVDGGEYIIGASVPGREAWRTTVAVPVEGGKVTAVVPKLQPPSPEVVTEPTKPPPPVVDTGEHVEHRWLTSRRKLALGAGGVAVLAGGIGIVLGKQALDRRDQAYQLCPDPTRGCANAAQANALIEQNHDRSTQADIAFAIAGAAVIAGGVLWFTGAPKEDRGAVAIAPLLGQGAGGIALAGSF